MAEPIAAATTPPLAAGDATVQVVRAGAGAVGKPNASAAAATGSASSSVTGTSRGGVKRWSPFSLLTRAEPTNYSMLVRRRGRGFVRVCARLVSPSHTPKKAAALPTTTTTTPN
jgi:hypothetical protein